MKCEYDNPYYSDALYTSDILDLDDIMKFIIITRTNTLCNSYKNELSIVINSSWMKGITEKNKKNKKSHLHILLYANVI